MKGFCRAALRHTAKSVGKRLQHEAKLLPADSIAFNAERNPIGPVAEKDAGNQRGSDKSRKAPFAPFERPNDSCRTENEPDQFVKQGGNVFKMRIVMHNIPKETRGIP